MKKNIKSLFAFMFTLSMFACNSDLVNEDTVKPPTNEGKWTLGTSATTTRVAIGDSDGGVRPLNWEEADELTVFNAGTEALFTLTNGQATSAGVFESDSEELENRVNYYAIHTMTPYSFSNEIGLTVTYPSVKIVSGTMDEFINNNVVLLSDAFQFSAMSVNGVTMKNQIAVLEIPVKIGQGQAHSLSSIQIETTVADYFVTKAVYNGSGGVNYTCSTQMTVNFATAVELNDETAVIVKLPIWMNPALTETDIAGKDFKLTFTGSLDETIAETTKSAVLLLAGKYYYSGNSQSINAQTVKGVQLENEAQYIGYKSASVALVKDEIVQFNNFEDIEPMLNPTYFEYVSPGKAKFLGASGTYEIHLRTAQAHFYVEQKDADNALWLRSNTLGFPNLGTLGNYAVNGTPWGHETSVNAPHLRHMFRNDGNGIYVCAVYSNWVNAYIAFDYQTNEYNNGVSLVGSGYLDLTDYTRSANMALDAASKRVTSGGSGFVAGRVYTVIVDTQSKTISLTLGLSGISGVPAVKGVNMVGGTFSGYLSATVALQKNEEVSFSNIAFLSRVLNPVFFEYISPGKAKFLGPNGTYELHLRIAEGQMYVEQTGATDDDALWLRSNTLGFPNIGNLGFYAVNGTPWGHETTVNAPHLRHMFRNDGNGVYICAVYTTWVNAYIAFDSMTNEYNNGASLVGSNYLDLTEYTRSANMALDATSKRVTSGGSGFVTKSVYTMTIDTTAKTISMVQN